MAEKKSKFDRHNKPITTTRTPETAIADTAGLFNVSRFETSIHEKGYDVWHEKALRCPCLVPHKHAPLVNCKNCGGTGWVFINTIQTKMLFSSMAKKRMTKEWSDVDTGTAMVSALPVDRLGLMDRITLICAEAFHNEVLFIKKEGDTQFAFLLYQPLEVDYVYQFMGSNNPLKILREGEDFDIQRNLLILNNDKFPFLSDGDYLDDNTAKPYSLSIRYKHQPQYHIVDILRDIVSTPVNLISQAEPSITPMPVYALARKAHYVLDELNFYGEGLFDNSDPLAVTEKC